MLEEMRDEVWGDIPGFNNFQVSTLGNVRSKSKTWTCGNGAVHHYPCKPVKMALGSKRGRHDRYYRVVLRQDDKTKTFNVARLVAIVFVPNPDNKPQVDHINRNSRDNRACNLRWVTAKENCANRGGKYGRQ